MKKDRIKLTLTHSQDKPVRDPCCGYEFEAPVNGLVELDVDGSKQAPERFRVTRFWKGEEDLQGRLESL